MPDDHGPGVRLPPPVIVVAALLLGWGLQQLVPVRLGPPAVAFGGMLIFLAVGWIGWALLVLVRAGNDPRPDRPDQVFVAAGPYRFGRNPIYAGFLLFLAGVALSWGTLWAWLAVGAAFLALDLLVVRREEAYLRGRFPESYPAYAARTRRWV
ncbi:isoprenylcysteine carboxylmethyltransferase family protein [Sediminicoccus sp. KRV36]|uniref:methyltransferase family protein n=1 Tax=Sediminicoccus sp. KRV36 TaxID=3133721 RepID=UPI00200D01FD|nr:isoprenylcysteine carboxylmethyltransferase family protein [Sediminicoccus rosea]UPY37850.1 isoprenylcysteine carboxylmethyltransferase family protein [Sediminicoccus rosea]